MSNAPHHIFTHGGDASAEVEEIARRLRAELGSDEAAGFVKYLYVSQAKMTVVFLTRRETRFAAELRARGGWREPGDQAL